MSKVMTEPGIYRARIIASNVEEKDTGSVRFGAQYEAYQYKEGGQWHDLDTPETIFGDVWIVKKDGTLNDQSIKRLMEAIEWDGASFSALADTDWSGTEVQITVGEEEYEGKVRPKMQWLNHRDFEGGMKSSDATTLGSLDNRFGSQLRALSGGAKKPAQATPKDGQAATMANSVWADFQKLKTGMPEADQRREFVEYVRAVCGKQAHPNRLTGAEWERVDVKLQEDIADEVNAANDASSAAVNGGADDGFDFNFGDGQPAGKSAQLAGA